MAADRVAVQHGPSDRVEDCPASGRVSSPVSSRRVVSVLDAALECSVVVGFTRRMRTAWEVGGPEIGSSAVAGEVGDGVAQLFVAGPTESAAADLSRLPRSGSDTGRAGQRFGCGDAGAAVADFGEQSAGTGQAGEASGQILELVGTDNHNGPTGLECGVNHRPPGPMAHQ